MKFDQLCVPKMKIPRFLQKITLQQEKNKLIRDLLPKICSPLKSETERVCILNLPRPVYIAKRGKGELQQLRSKSFKTPTNKCQENLIEFENKKKNKNLAIQVRKIDDMKRKIVKDQSYLSKKLGDNLLRVSTDSLVYRQTVDPKRGKKLRDKDDNMSAKITDKLIRGLRNHYNQQKHQKDYNYLRKKYAQLTFHEIIQSESDQQQNPNRLKAERRKVKTQMSQTDKK